MLTPIHYTYFLVCVFSYKVKFYIDEFDDRFCYKAYLINSKVSVSQLDGDNWISVLHISDPTHV